MPSSPPWLCTPTPSHRPSALLPKGPDVGLGGGTGVQLPHGQGPPLGLLSALLRPQTLADTYAPPGLPSCPPSTRTRDPGPPRRTIRRLGGHGTRPGNRGSRAPSVRSPTDTRVSGVQYTTRRTGPSPPGPSRESGRPVDVDPPPRLRSPWSPVPTPARVGAVGPWSPVETRRESHFPHFRKVHDR